MDITQDIIITRREIMRGRRQHGYHHGKCDAHPTQMPLLAFLAAHDGCTQREIAQEMCIAPATVAVSVRRLVASGFAKKLGNEQDARTTRICITEKGASEAQRANEEIYQLSQKELSGFSQAEKEQYLEYLIRIRDNIKKEDCGEADE